MFRMLRDGVTRRRVLQAAGSAAVGGAVVDEATGHVSAQSSEAWPQFGYDAANTGHAPDNTGPVGEVQNEWTFGAREEVQSSPVVVDGTVYVGSADGTVYALDAGGATVTEQWTFEGSAGAPPTVADGTVYVGGGTVYALDAADGTEQWNFEMGAVVESLAVADGTVYVGSAIGNIYARDAADGTAQERFVTGVVYSPLAVADGTVYVGIGDGVHALDVAEGTEQWTFQTEGDVHSSPAVADSTIYVGSNDGNVYGLDAADGTEQWTFQTGAGISSSPAVADGTVYVGSGENVYALDAADGTEQWIFPTERTVHSPAVADGTVYVGSGNKVYALTEPSTPGNETSPTVAQTPEPGTETRASPATGGGGAEGGNSIETLLSVLGSGIEEYIPLLSVLGVAGAGGVGAWLYRRDGDTGDSGAPTSRGSSPPTRSPSTGSSRQTNYKQVTQTPAEIPREPEVSVEYDALADREPIGSGGNADVSKTTLSGPNGEVKLAIKEPRVSGTLHTDTVERMLQEAQTWAKLDGHDHIVGIIDYGSEPVPWIAMEYMDGGHLGERRDEMSLSQKLWTAIAVTKGVRHAHRRGVAHLDLKPQNILFRTVEDGWDVPKVADWGLSKHLLEHSNSIEGLSPHYAAPEQFDDSYGSTDDVTDIYQLGAVFYELFTGHPPFDGRPTEVMRAVLDDQPAPPSDVPAVPEAIDEILLTALAKSKDDRYDDIILLRDALQELFDN